MKFIPITISKNRNSVDCYTIANFAQETLGRGKFVPYHYFKMWYGRKSSRKLDAGFAKLREIYNRDKNKLVVFLSEEDFIVSIDSCVHIWDPRKQSSLNKPENFLKEKDQFLNWFRDVFPKFNCT